MTEDRLDWIERWAKGWLESLGKRSQEEYYSGLALEAACEMLVELVNAAKDSE